MKQEKIYLGDDRKLSTTMVLNQCPVTVGQRTKMSREAFGIACNHRQGLARNAKFSGELANRYCLTCQGAIIPKEIEFTD